MDGLTLLLIYHMISLVSAVLLPPRNLKLVSKNFRHILTWDDPNNESVIYYKVGYDNYERKLSKSCSNITRRHCDLTKDFTDVLSEYVVWVYSFTDGEVSNKTTKVFCPIIDTTLGPALVNVVPGNNSIEVFIDPPISHLWDETEQRNVTMVSDGVYPLMEYTIHYGQSGESPQHMTLQSTMNSTVISQLLPNTNYCVSVTVSTVSNFAPSIPSAQKCVITGPPKVLQGSSLDVIIPVLCGIFLFLGILLTLFALDRAGYIGKRRSFIPKVLKSFSRSESRYSGSNECPSPTCVVPVEIVSQKPELKESQETKGQYQEGGYACRKKLLDSDTSAGDSSGPTLSSNLGSSGQMTGSSDEERISLNHQIDLDIVTDSSGSFSPIPANDLGSSSDLPLNNSGVLNINLNSICIGSSGDTLTGLKIGGSLKEEPMEKTLINSGQAELSLNGDITVCMPNILVDSNPTETDYGSDNYEEDLSDNADNEDLDLVGSGYMRR